MFCSLVFHSCDIGSAHDTPAPSAPDPFTCASVRSALKVAPWRGGGHGGLCPGRERIVGGATKCVQNISTRFQSREREVQIVHLPRAQNRSGCTALESHEPRLYCYIIFENYRLRPDQPTWHHPTEKQKKVVMVSSGVFTRGGISTPLEITKNSIYVRIEIYYLII